MVIFAKMNGLLTVAAKGGLIVRMFFSKGRRFAEKLYLCRLIAAPMLHRRAFLILLVPLFLLASCHREEEYQPTPYHLVIPPHFPTDLNIPDDNPLTVEGVALGKALFSDPIIRGYTGTSPDSMFSCATCHVPSSGFDLGADNPYLRDGRPVGVNGTSPRHNAMPLVNLVFNHEGYLWNGAASSLESIVGAAIRDPDELASSPERVVSALSASAAYREMFRKAFGTEEVTLERIQMAVAQYLRTLIAADSKFDRYLRGEEQLTAEELRGYVLFSTEEGADCYHCHGGAGTPLFTTNLFYNNGLDAVPNLTGDRSSVTGKDSDRGAYRAPSLRNVAVSAPYMHDGRFTTLDEVLQFYNTGLQNSPYVHPYMHHINDGGICLTPSQLADLKSFLLTLTDDTVNK